MASRYFLNIGTDYGSTANWSTTSGGAGGASVPGASDDVFFDANSGNCDLNANRSATAINFTGYTGTINFSSFNLRNTGNLTLSPTMTMTATTGYLDIPIGTVTSNGYVVPINVRMTVGGSTITLADNFETSAGTELRLFANNAGGSNFINSNEIRVGGNLYFSISSGHYLLGTTLIKLVGTGSVESLNASGTSSLSLEINTAGTITFNGTTTLWCNFTYTAGTVVASTGSTLLFNYVGGIFATKSLNLGASNNWYNLSFNNNGFDVRLNLTSDINVTNNLTFTANTQQLALNNNTIYCSGNLNGNAGNNIVRGTVGQTPTTIVMNGTGTITCSGTVNGWCYLNITIDTTGMVSLTGTFNFGVGTFTITTPNNFDGVSLNGTFRFVTISTMVLNGDVTFWELNVWVATVSGGNIHVYNNLIIGLSNNASGISGCDIYLYGNLLYNGGLGGTTTIGNNFYIVGSGVSTWTSLSVPSNPILTNIVFNKSGKVLITGPLIVFGAGSTTHIKGEIIMTRKTDRIIYISAHTFNGTINKLRFNNVRFIQNIQYTFNKEFFCGTAENPLLITTSGAYPYNTDVAAGNYVIVNNSRKELISHFTKVRGASVIGPQLLLTYNNPKLGPGLPNNAGKISYLANQLPQGFAKNSPIIVKEPMFGKLTADPMIVR